MRDRNFSMERYWLDLVDRHVPALSFKGSTRAHWREWRREARARFLELLGLFPEPAPLAPEVESSVRDGDLIRERIVFDSEPGMSVPCLALRPAAMKSDRSNPAILCIHGHSPYAKDSVAGIESGPEIRQNILSRNYDYGRQMARAGFLTLSPDLRVFGERRDGPDPFPGRDACNVNYLRGTMIGYYPLTLNIFDMKRCVDYLETRPEVDPQRIGMMGLSLGGTMTTFTAAAEERIKAADIIGYVNPWRRFAYERPNCCGTQVVPHIFRYFDTHDIAGLVAPRPLLLEMGIADDCFPIQHLAAGAEGVRRIYSAAGAEDSLWTEIHPGGHAFGGNKAFEFFRRHL